MILYLDTSAIVKLYSDEPGAALVRKAVGRADMIATCLISYTETRSALARKRRLGEINEGMLAEHKREFEQDWETMHHLPINEATVRRAGILVEQYGLRAYDGIHLASVEALQLTVQSSAMFACFDKALNEAASSFGLRLLD